VTNYIGFAAIAGCYLAIIALYVWVFRQVQEMRNDMHKHVQNFDSHTSSDKLMFKDVCDEKVLRIESKVDNLKETITDQFNVIKSFMQNNAEKK
jgi:hypothetical protein